MHLLHTRINLHPYGGRRTSKMVKYHLVLDWGCCGFELPGMLLVIDMQ